MLDDEYRLNIKRMLCNLEGRPAEIDNFLKNLAFSKNPSEATEYAWEIIQKMYEQESLLGLSDYGLNPPGSSSNDFPPDEPESPEDDDSDDNHRNDNDDEDDDSQDEDDGDNEGDEDEDNDDSSDDDSDEDESDEDNDSDEDSDNEDDSDDDSDNDEEDESDEDENDEDDDSDNDESDDNSDDEDDNELDADNKNDENEDEDDNDDIEDNHDSEEGNEENDSNEGDEDTENDANSSPVEPAIADVKPSSSEPVSRVNREIKASKTSANKNSFDKHKDNKKQTVSAKADTSLNTEHLISIPEDEPKVPVKETVIETQNNDLVIRIPEDMRDVINNGPVYLLPADTGKDAEFRIIQLRVSTDENLQQARKIHQEIAEALEMEKKIRDNIFAQLQVFKGLSEQLSENVEQASEIRQMLLDGTTRAERFLNNDMLRLLQQRANEATNEFYQESKDHYNDLFRAAVKRYKQFTQAAMEFQDKMSDENEKTIRNIQSRVNMIQNVTYFLCIVVLFILALTIVFKVF